MNVIAWGVGGGTSGGHQWAPRSCPLLCRSERAVLPGVLLGRSTGSTWETQVAQQRVGEMLSDATRVPRRSAWCYFCRASKTTWWGPSGWRGQSAAGMRRPAMSLCSRRTLLWLDASLASPSAIRCPLTGGEKTHTVPDSALDSSSRTTPSSRRCRSLRAHRRTQGSPPLFFPKLFQLFWVPGNSYEHRSQPHSGESAP